MTGSSVSSLLNVVGTVSVELNEWGGSKDVGESVGSERVEVGSSVGSSNDVGVSADSVLEGVSSLEVWFEVRSLASDVLESESLFDEESSRDSEEDQSDEECQLDELSVLDVADEE